VTEDNLPPASAHMKSNMTPIQVADLERFLTNSNFKYDDYDQELGVVLYDFTVGDWTIEVAYGNECYYRLYNDVTEEACCEELTDVSEVMVEYKKLCLLKPMALESRKVQDICHNNSLNLKFILGKGLSETACYFIALALALKGSV